MPARDSGGEHEGRDSIRSDGRCARLMTSNGNPGPTDPMPARPELNNKELVHRALDTLQIGLQDYIISEMSFRHGTSWWAQEIVPKRIQCHLSPDIPVSKDVSNETVRTYMDVTSCLKIIEEMKLIPTDLPKQTIPLLKRIRDIRNALCHSGDVDYEWLLVMESILSMINASKMLSLGVTGELEKLLGVVISSRDGSDATAAPSEPAAPESQGAGAPAERTASASSPKAGAAPAAGPAQQPESRRPCSLTHSFGQEIVGDICILASSGFRSALQEEQEVRPKTARFINDVIKVEPSALGFILKMKNQMQVDDSLGIIVDGKEFSGSQVSFDNYNRTARTINLYPSHELREALESNSGDVHLFTDTKWLAERTESFFVDYGDYMRFPPAPNEYRDSGIITAFGISDEQEASVRSVLSNPISYVWGVPGSGKTQSVLAASICECLAHGERIAVIAPTNVALEQVLRGLLKAFSSKPEIKGIIDPQKDVLRVGTPTSDFAREFPYVCEDKGLKKQHAEKVSRRRHLCRVLLEGEYESFRKVCDEAVEDAGRIPASDEAGRARIWHKLTPVLDAMRRDDRFSVNAMRVTRSNVAEYAPFIRKLLYNRERSDYMDELKDVGESSIKKEIAELDVEIERIRPRDRTGDLSTFKVVAMTLSRFIISFGPRESNGRKKLDVDRVFVDEAGYCNSIQAASLFTLGVPIAMLGDHMQLPPVCELKKEDLLEWIDDGGDKRCNFLWDMSALYMDHYFDGSMDALARMYRHFEEPDFPFTAHTMLKRTYRFGPNMAEVLAGHVYGAGMDSASESLDIVVVDARTEEFPKDSKGNSLRINKPEAQAVCDYIRANRLANDDDYVVLAAYRDQVSEIKRIGRTIGDHVLTIHKSQGREWDTVIISVCDGRANEAAKKELRLTSSRRTVEGAIGLKVINTALSRAKRRLVLVCDTEFWRAQEGELIGDIVRMCG